MCSGDVVVMQVTEQGVAPRFRFAGGHQAVVRSFHWDSTSNLVITGAEDSRLCVWAPTPPAVPPVVPSPSREGPVRWSHAVSLTRPPGPKRR